MEKHLVPKLTALSENRYLSAIRAGMVATVLNALCLQDALEEGRKEQDQLERDMALGLSR